MNSNYFCLIASLLFAGAMYGNSQQRPDLNGVWRLDPSKCEIHSRAPSDMTWQIEQTDDGIHLIQRFGGQQVDDVKCGTDGKDCKIKDEGHSAVANFYYNGPVLVELESQGSNKDTVTKKRISVSPDGTVITVDVIHVLPQGKPNDKLVLSKQTAAAAH